MDENILNELKTFFASKILELTDKVETLQNQVKNATENGTDEMLSEASDRSVAQNPLALIMADQSMIPQRFTGENADYSVENFKFAVEYWLVHRLGSTKVDEYDIITWIGNLLGGKPGKWWSKFALESKETAPRFRSNLESFWSELRHCFAERKLPFNDELSFIGLRQEKLSIDEFNAQFRQMASCVDWSREKLEAAFYLSKLSSFYVNALKSSPPIPKNIDLLMESTSLADPRFMQSWVSTNEPTEPNKRVVYSSSVRKPEKRCFNCDRPGHIRPDCPLLRTKPKFVANAGPSAGNNAGQGKAPATRQ